MTEMSLVRNLGPIKTLLSNDKRVFVSREKLMKNASITKFLSGVRSAFDMLPEQTTYRAYFIKNNRTKIYRFSYVQDLNESWILVGKMQENAFNQLKCGSNKNYVPYEQTCH